MAKGGMGDQRGASPGAPRPESAGWPDAAPEADGVCAELDDFGFPDALHHSEPVMDDPGLLSIDDKWNGRSCWEAMEDPETPPWVLSRLVMETKLIDGPLGSQPLDVNPGLGVSRALAERIAARPKAVKPARRILVKERPAHKPKRSIRFMDPPVFSAQDYPGDEPMTLGSSESQAWHNQRWSGGRANSGHRSSSPQRAEVTTNRYDEANGHHHSGSASKNGLGQNEAWSWDAQKTAYSKPGDSSWEHSSWCSTGWGDSVGGQAWSDTTHAKESNDWVAYKKLSDVQKNDEKKVDVDWKNEGAWSWNHAGDTTKVHSCGQAWWEDTSAGSVSSPWRPNESWDSRHRADSDERFNRDSRTRLSTERWPARAGFCNPPRDWRHPEGLSLENFSLGQAVTGRVTNVTPVGVFIDVGAEKDGCLHDSAVKASGRTFRRGDYVCDLEIYNINLQKRRFSCRIVGTGPARAPRTLGDSWEWKHDSKNESKGWNWWESEQENPQTVPPSQPQTSWQDRACSSRGWR